MAAITERNGWLIVDFRYQGVRCREKTKLEANAGNKKRLLQVVKRIEAEITLGTFEYAKYFPNSKKLAQFELIELKQQSIRSEFPTFKKFAESWMTLNKVQWRHTNEAKLRGMLVNHIYPRLGDVLINNISKNDVLKLRTDIIEQHQRLNKSMDNAQVNKIVQLLKRILNEAADEYQLVPTWQKVKSLKVNKKDIEPFTLQEVEKVLAAAHPDFKCYYLVRFFTGMRTAEIDGLTWEKVDFARRQILVHKAWVQGEFIATKTDGSYRTIEMNDWVFDALKNHYEKADEPSTGFVFCNTRGGALDRNNVRLRFWYPMLERAGVKKRPPYQTRHTAATLWLASGESPEWIAKQMGHSTTDMLFTVYSRYVPNLTRKDGSAFEQLVRNNTQL